MKTWWNSLSLKNKLQIPIQTIILAMRVIAQRLVLSQFGTGMPKLAAGAT